MKELIKFENATQLVAEYPKLSQSYLTSRLANAPEFAQKFTKTFGDLLFSSDEEMLNKISKTKPNTLMNAIFTATEANASFAKREVYLVPYEVKGGGYTATVIVDINFQKQLILSMPNCKRFFTAQIKDGVEVIQNLETGLMEFVGKNDFSKETVGYYARFETKDGEVYDLFMNLQSIKERASFSPTYKPKNYENPNNNVHYEKIVVRNLLKIIPQVTEELQSTIDLENFVSYEEIVEEKDEKALENAKKELSEAKEDKKAVKKTTKTEKKAKTEPKTDEIDVF